jgi:hypothetical protein
MSDAYSSWKCRVAGRCLLTSGCVESASGTGRAKYQVSRRGVGRALHRDVCTVVGSGGLG